ncbi:hypothetical protein HDU90_008866 [Geranomyces variabilis]|nr:hypothetical protein HDU90_008866 [Geranomyces variabilis]
MANWCDADEQKSVAKATKVPPIAAARSAEIGYDHGGHLKQKHDKWLVKFRHRGIEFRTHAVADTTTARQVRDRLFAQLEVQCSYNLQIRKLNEDVLHSMGKKKTLLKDRNKPYFSEEGSQKSSKKEKEEGRRQDISEEDSQ